jgi:hypothetical protein
MLSLFIVCMGLNAMTTYADGCSAVNFKGARDYAFGLNYYSLATGDFNSDAKPDIAATDVGSNSVRVSFGDGTGGFLSTNNTPVGADPVFVIAGDMNNDGKLDLVTSNSGSNDVSVLLNNGTGSFTVTSYGASVGPVSLALADFNGDGKLDVVATRQTGDVLVLLLNNGSGGLLPLTFISVGNNKQPKDVVTGDFNNDGNADVATANNPGGVSVLLGTGMGTFANPVSVPAQGFGDPRFITAGDFTGDGKLDLVVTFYDAQMVGVFVGSGTGGFTQSGTAFPTNGNSIDVDLKDINFDGKLDIIVANLIAREGSGVKILFGNGSGGVSDTQDVLAGYYARSIAAADLNSDGKLDIITTYADLFDSGPSVALNDGTGKLETATSTGISAQFALLYDVNADGKLDLLSISNSGLQVRLGLGDSGGGFAAPATYAAAFGTHLVVGDFNSDGRPDIAGASAANVAVLLNTGNGNFAPPVFYGNGAATSALVTGDFTGDGKLDLVVASYGNRTVRTFTGDGTGHFLLTNSTNLDANPAAIVSGDFNNDGKLDVITANDCQVGSCTAKAFTLFVGNGAGGFGTPTDLFDSVAQGTGYIFPQYIAAGDFNLDGRIDITVPNSNFSFTNRIVAYNMGGGNFATRVGLPSTADMYTSVVSDINGDGKPDIVLGGGSYSKEVKILLNNGSGFDQPVTYVGVLPMRTIAVGDINADGKRDILFGSSDLFKMLNKCALTRSKATTDFDGDGITDLSVFRPSTGYWYIIYSSDSSFHVIPFGTNGDLPVPGDYDGDGRTDVAVFRPSNATWYYLRSSDGAFSFQQFGQSGDVPVPGDYDGDGRTNFAVWRASTGTWYTSLDPNTNYGAVVWGASTDTPVPADYDGDGRTDIAVFRPSNAFWYLLQSAQGYREQQFGISTDTPVPADYDGDGKDDFAVFRASTGTWYTSLNPATNYGAIPLGQNGDVPVPGYYDGDGRVDAAVFRQGDWYIFQSTTSTVRGVHFGASGDVPAPIAP